MASLVRVLDVHAFDGLLQNVDGISAMDMNRCFHQRLSSEMDTEVPALVSRASMDGLEYESST